MGFIGGIFGAGVGILISFVKVFSGSSTGALGFIGRAHTSTGISISL
jgi:hypothetical protein